MHVFITRKTVYWFTEKIKDLFLCDRIHELRHLLCQNEFINWFFKNLFEKNLDLQLYQKGDFISGVFLQVLWTLT